MFRVLGIHNFAYWSKLCLLRSKEKISLFLFCLHRDRRGHLLQSLPKSRNIFHQLRMQFIYNRAAGARGAEGTMTPPDFGRSVDPISTRGWGWGSLCLPNNDGTPGFSDLPTALWCTAQQSAQSECCVEWRSVGVHFLRHKLDISSQWNFLRSKKHKVLNMPFLYYYFLENL